jgi:hypothetical protein
MNSISLCVDELKTILAIINELNPPNIYSLGAGTAEISVDSSSGIGSVVTVTIPMTCGNYYGKFSTTITDESDW